MKIYTDGSFSSKGMRGGWAFVVVDGDRIVEEKHGTLKDTTCNRCELTAIIRAIQHAVAQEWEYFEILTDSKYCQQGMTKWAPDWSRRGWKTASGKEVANVDLWKRLEGMLETVESFKVTWIKGHNGNTFNNRADFLASRGVK